MKKKWDKQAIVRRLKELASDDLSIRMDKCNRYLVVVMLREFGSYTAAVKAAGLRAGVGSELRVCRLEGCGSTVRSSNADLCEKHYYRLRRNGHFYTEVGIPSVVNHRSFSELNDARAWVLGLIWSDGCLNRERLLITSKDYETLEQVQQVLDGDGLIRTRKCGRYYDIYIKSDQIVRDLIARGLTERKSLTVEWPIGLPESLGWAFLRGVIDGDGSVSLRRSASGRDLRLRVVIYTASSRFASSVVDFFTRAGMRVCVTITKRPNCTLTAVNVYRVADLKLLYWNLYRSIYAPSMERKRVAFKMWMCRPTNVIVDQPRGERKPMAVLSDAAVIRARREYRSGGATVSQLSVKHGVSKSSMRSAIRGDTWSHVSEPPVVLQGNDQRKPKVSRPRWKL